MNRTLRLLLPAISAALLAACASSRGLHARSTLQDPDQLQAQRTLQAARIDAAAWPQPQWWQAFGDPQLDRLMDEALAGNPDLRIADARLRQALALAAAADTTRKPGAEISGQGAAGRFAQNGFIPPPYNGAWAGFEQINAMLSWNLDLWGKNRATYESAVGTARAAQLDSQAARLTLTVSIARIYAQMAGDYQQLDIANDTLKQRQQILDLTRQRNHEGLDSMMEVRQAEAAVPAAREQIGLLVESTEQARNALAALIGAGPDRALTIQHPQIQAAGGDVLPTSVPSELLGHRPDLLAQRWRVEAAARGIAAAHADFYPNVNLIAFAGFQNLGTAAFLTWANRQYGVAPAITLPLFDAGRRRAALAGRDADYDAAVEQYNKALDEGLHDVADALTAMRSLDLLRRDAHDGLTTAQQAYDLAIARYREGLTNHLNVLSTESQLLSQRTLNAQLSAQTLIATIDLTRALGGGFTPPVAAFEEHHP